MDFGKTFKQIRKSKGMTLKEAAGESMSQAQLSRFENEQSMVTVDLLYEMLSNINTTPQEYYFLMGADPEKELKDFFYRIIELDGKFQETEVLETEREKLKDSNPGPYDWQRYMIYFIENLIKAKNNEPFDADNYVRDYLMQIEDWGERELRIYALFGFILPVETTYFLMKTAVKRSQLYQGIPQDMKLLHTILTNNFSTFIFHNRLDYAKETLLLFEESLKHHSEFVESHLNLLFNKGIFAFKEENVEKGKRCCEQVLSLCEILQQKERGKMYAYRYKTWVKEYDNPDFKEITIEPGILGFTLDG
ncbi:transcriptional activator, Rgg/GadR/MutR family, C-terminal domain-containing protein [Atopostipes suicloacalis DSM 15692]|uniref:Transcriptional activator, Rgg/GadR/MutR family, C-terminal domain-containing protein n=1 Tax=Atopostipes suicloacalis DSM 15692 TaxID=1121025 RepID=A0A1M4U1P2_9LACT|nr:Rgg/GadR/MutR family transcriptional regulator [Atopostipes suicloacalis]SHE50652.1 transcriptional activator, Rgg/GadR/MutR family, C-terminal domain-containing protein [Atopostipes suicloacalis DSM 15692]